MENNIKKDMNKSIEEILNEMKFGCIPSPKDDRDYHLSKLMASDTIPTDFPASFRISYTGYIKDQGNINSCVSHASAYTREIIEQKQSGKYKEFSVGLVYANRKDTDNQGTGMYIREALQGLVESGDVLEPVFPFNLEYPDILNVFTPNKSTLLKDAAKYKISAYCTLNTINEIKTALMNLGPVIIGVPVYDSFAQAYYTGNVPLPNTQTDKKSGNHALTLLGWKDNGDWICLNSWGGLWGDYGYVYIPNTYPLNEAWSLTDNILPQPMPEISNIEFNMAAYIGNTVTVNYTYSHPNNVPEGNTEITWRDDDSFKTLSIGPSYTFTTDNENKYVRVEIRSSDTNGITGDTAVNVIGPVKDNNIPKVSNVKITADRSPATEDAQFTLTYDYFSPEGIAEGTDKYRIKWACSNDNINYSTKPCIWYDKYCGEKTMSFGHDYAGYWVFAIVEPIDANGKTGNVVYSNTIFDTEIPRNPHAMIKIESSGYENQVGHINHYIQVYDESYDQDYITNSVWNDRYDFLLKQNDGRLYFNKAGQYTLTLTVYNKFNLSDTCSETINVLDTPKNYIICTGQYDNIFQAQIIAIKLKSLNYNPVVKRIDNYFTVQILSSTIDNFSQSAIGDITKLGFETFKLYI